MTEVPRPLRTGHTPYEVWTLRGCVGIGIIGLLIGLPPTPGIARVVWLLTMVIGGTIALVGIRRTIRVDVVSGLVVEQAGLIPLAIATGAYCGAILTFGPREGWLDAVLWAVGTVAAAARSWEIHVDLVHHSRIVGRRE